MSDGQTGPDEGWSDRYAETGGWPPPTPGQRRYEPGSAPPAPPAPPAGDDGDLPAGGGYGAPPARWGQPADQAETGGHGSPAVPGETGGYGSPILPGEIGGYGGPAVPGYSPGYGGPAASGYPSDGDGGFPVPGEPTAGYGPAQGQTGAAPWAPGDSAYGRLTGGPRQPARQPPRRPWDGRPQPPRPARRGLSGTPVTIALVGICVFVYLLQQADPTITVRYGLLPAAVENGQYERLLTAAFLHANVLHLATNMITLYIVGAPLERVLRTGRFLTVYLLSALGGSLLSLWLSPEFSLGVGASGAIFGLFGALVVLRRQVGAEAGGLAVLIGLNLFISFAVPNISWQAHIGGLVTGVLVALVIAAANRVNRRPAT